MDELFDGPFGWLYVGSSAMSFPMIAVESKSTE